MPAVGTHITMTGPYVLNKEHNGWAGIHSVTNIT